MIAELKNWLMTLIAVSILCAAAESLMASGGGKQVGRFTCGLVILCVMLRPLTELRGISVADELRSYAGELAQWETHWEARAGQTRKSVIEEQCAAYISDKAAQLGVLCRAEVVCEPSGDGLYLPRSAVLRGDFDNVTQSRMTELLERQLGIPVSAQTYHPTKEETP